MPNRKILWRIFIAALAIRWGYAIALYVTMGQDGLMLMDSRGYLVATLRFTEQLRSGALGGWDSLGVDLSTMPLVSWGWVITQLVFGTNLVLASVLIQGVMDSVTCLFVCELARTFRESFAVPAGIFAAVNPTQIVMTGLFYTDTMFLFFVALMLLAAARWLKRPDWTWAVILGLALGGAGLSRILVVPWTAALLAFFAVVVALRRPVFRTALAQIAATGAIFVLCVAPVVARNVIQYGSLSLTPQTGAYSALWLAPLVRQVHDGTPWAQGAADMQKEIDAKVDKSITDPFELSKRHTEIGREAMWRYGWAAITKAWLYGAAINFASPALLLSPPVITLPRTGFYDTPGTSMPEKIWNFLFRADNKLYAWLLLIGIAGVAVLRLIQLTGLIGILRHDGVTAPLLLLGGWVAFILLVNGPIASPKYRLPMEPALTVMAAAGFVTIRDRSRGRKLQTA
jgi:4-amino-4-deoxy-L-arabinose transferase-like glycosyltransferase